MQVNYIFNSKGKPEYAVIPFLMWENMEKINQNKKNKFKKDKNKFNPENYIGILSHLELNIETELLDMRKEWNRSI